MIDGLSYNGRSLASSRSCNGKVDCSCGLKYSRCAELRAKHTHECACGADWECTIITYSGKCSYEYSLQECWGCGHNVGKLIKEVESGKVKRINEELETCNDCEKQAHHDQMGHWKWWDFSSNQADETLPICRECRKLPRHQERLKKDREDEKAEMEEQKRHDAEMARDEQEIL